MDKWIKRAIKYLKSKKFKLLLLQINLVLPELLFDTRCTHFTQAFTKELIKYGTSFDKIYFCPYHKDGVVKKYKKNSNLRKPKIGMFLKVKKIWKIDKKNSFMIGDQTTDMEFAKRARIKGYLFKHDNLYKFIKNKNI